jgi:Tol biopolymer transport system component
MRRHKKTIPMLAIAFLIWSLSIPAPATQSQQKAEVALKNALEKETVDGDLKAAIAQYQAITKMPGAGRAVVAKALLQLAGCYEKQGNTEARKIFEQLAKDYTDQQEIAAQARSRLEMSAPDGSASTGLQIRRIEPKGITDIFGRPSPDGRYLAYEDNSGDLAVYDIAAGTSRKLTQSNKAKGSLNAPILWSPDGRMLAYTWEFEKKLDLRVINFDASNERILYPPENNSLDLCGWFPDGKSLLFSMKKNAEPRRLFSISVENSSIQTVRDFEKASFYSSDFSCFSPDGKNLAYISRTTPQGKRDLFVFSLAGGEETKINQEPGDIELFGWAPDSRSIYFRSDIGVSHSLYRVRFNQGRPAKDPELIKENMGRIAPLGITKKGAIYYYSFKSSSDAMIADVDLSKGWYPANAERVNSTRIGMCGNPAWAPSGEQLAYLARTSVNEQGFNTLCIWSLKDRKQKEIRLRNPFTGLANGHLSWSPDERYILGTAYDISAGTQSMVRVQIQNGEESIITAVSSAVYTIIGWTRDATTVFAIKRQSRSIVKRNCQSGQETQLFLPSTMRSGFRWSGDILSPDGNWIAIIFDQPTTRNPNKLIAIPVGGGAAHELAESKMIFAPFWSSDSQYLYYETGTQNSEMWRVAVAGGPPSRLSQNQQSVSRLNATSISFDPSGRRIAFETSSRTYECWVMENLPVVK